MKSKIFVRLAGLITGLLFVCISYAQVTTGSISGTVKDNHGEPLVGATVKVTHVPSGTNYYAMTQANGNYFIQGVRVGDDFKVEFSFIGFAPKIIDGITILLGTSTQLDATLVEDSVTLSEVVITGSSISKTGTATNVTNQQIQALPSINRSINDFTKLTPQSNGGSSFAGRDGRYNYITVDGAAFNNSFGLSGQTRNLPGGDAQPISLDAIDQISVNIAPFDIRQSNFTGASVNAVTKSGDNTFKGSVYTFLRPESFAGKTVDGTKYEWDETSKQSYGLSLGGPIIKNKLFFFINGEYEKSNKPSTPWKTSTDGNADEPNYISRAQNSRLSALKQHLLSTYGYDPGDWDWKPFTSENYKILARVDWNINDNNKVTVRYNQVMSSNDVVTNNTSGPSRLTQGRIGEYGMAFTNAGYGFENTVRSITGEWNSTFDSRFANKFLVTYTSIRDKRTSPGDVFPFVDIMEGGNIYTSFGYELYTFNNDVKNNTFSIIDNFTVYLGDHTVTAGVSYEQMYFGNAYMGFGTGYYQYASMNDFINNAKPTIFAQTVGLNGNTSPYSELSFGTGAFYAQDEWQLLSNLKLTAGIRLEMPFYLNDLDPNPAIAALTFADGYKMDVGTWAKQQLLVSPRVSFNWDVLKDGKYKVRGGTGIFTGRLPFVWFTNQPTQAGTLQFQRSLSGAAVPNDLRFTTDIYAHSINYASLFSPTSAPSSPVEVSKDFKMPQIWRTNLAVDVKLPGEMTFTLEGLYSKDINAILQKNVNEAAPNATFAGSDNRPYYNGISNRIDPSISNAMVLGNTSEGYQYSITAQLAKDFSHGFTGAVAYTFSEAKDVTNNPGDQASSAWQSNVSVNSLNYPGLGYSYFSVPHRLIASLSYRFGYLHSSSSTTISLFYEGAPQGRLNYVYFNDLNGDGNGASDLMYIPKDRNDIVFVDKGAMTAQEQSDAFFKFLEQDEYLNSHRGEYAQRFGAVMPWTHRFDLKLIQDFVMDNVRKTKIQLTLDILNLGNLINSSWGVRRAQITGSYDNMPLLQYANSVDASGRPQFTLPTNSVDSYYTESYKNILDYTSTWSMQLGLRFIF
ncbi:MAG: TonB-dependent receptor [Prevotellaceae bacterium]|nr:TonB-dependent receptor [Prevotellaceae bacterium]